jgi:hypothetical protein
MKAIQHLVLCSFSFFLLVSLGLAQSSLEAARQEAASNCVRRIVGWNQDASKDGPSTKGAVFGCSSRQEAVERAPPRPRQLRAAPEREKAPAMDPQNEGGALPSDCAKVKCPKWDAGF